MPDAVTTIKQRPACTPKQARQTVGAAFKGADANSILRDLHAFELTFADNAEWPWMRWRHLSVEDPAYRDALPAKAPDGVATGLAANVLDAAIAVRRGSEAMGNGDLFGDLFEPNSGLMEASKSLGPSVQLELMMLAFHERHWKAVELLATRLLGANSGGHNGGITGDSAINVIMDDLLLDTLFFSIYRPYMPSYVQNPKPLIDKLASLSGTPNVERILARDTTSAQVYMANLLALEGNFTDALPLYAEAAAADGFRSPVFQQVQVLLAVPDLSPVTRQSDMDWYYARSKTSFHYRHDTPQEQALLVAVEPDYFNAYGKLYAQIVGTTNPGALIHFHLINFPADSDAVVGDLNNIEAECGVRINFTFEENQLMADRPQLKGGVCVNTRYIYLRDYLDAYAGVTITDIDGWLLKSIDDLSNFGDRDSLVSSWIWKKNTGYWRLPWANISGGYCSVRSTENSKQFADLVAHYLAKLFALNADKGKPMFYADQAAHFLCLKHAEARWGMQVGFIGGGFAQSEELPFHDRHAGKQKAMRDKLAELQAAHTARDQAEQQADANS